MSNIDRFNFENKDLDFPFYRKNPHVPKWGWIVLFIALFAGCILVMGSKIHILVLSCIILVVPVLYFLKWDYKAIFQKPSGRDVALAVALFVGYMIYSSVMGYGLEIFGIVPTVVEGQATISWMSVPPIFISLLSEEFIKFIPFIFFLRVAFKYSDNRKLSVIVAVLLAMMFFAALHAVDGNMLIFAIFIQGFGSIFEFIGYIKTKNILVSYMTHLCTDVSILVLAMFGF